MQRREVVDRSETPDGQPLELIREGGDFAIRVRNVLLMSSRNHGSEELLAEAACAGLADRPGASVLIGGLGMGFTLRAALDVLPADARVQVVELLPALIAWNRGPLAPLAGTPLDDPRVELVEGDLVQRIKRESAVYDAILLDVDNGPEALTVPGNRWLYGPTGLRVLRRRLRRGGRLGVWSSESSPKFEQRLHAAGYAVDARRVHARGRIEKGGYRWLFLGRA